MIRALHPGQLSATAEVVVIGSGAGGAVAAAELAAAGIDTILVEAGPHHDPATFDQREDGMMERLYAEGGQMLTHDHGMVVLAGRGLGGSTVHNTALCVPPPPAILERWEREAGLPAGVDTVIATASRVMARLEARLPDATEVNRNNRLLEEGARRLGLPVVHAWHNRSRCSGCGSCILGCAYNRKRNVLFSHLEGAVRGGLRIVTEAPVDRVRPAGAAGFRVLGPGVELSARRVVVAASALGTPALLVRSGLAAHPRVGRSLRLHPFAPVAGDFADPVDAHRGVPQSVFVTERSRYLDGGRGGSLVMAAAAGPGATAAFLPGVGAELLAHAARYRHLAAAGVLVHDETEGRVRPRRGGGERIDYWPGREDRREIVEGVADLARLFFAAGAHRVYLPFRRRPVIEDPDAVSCLRELPFRRYEVALNSVHPQGSVALGRDAARFPVDPEGRLRGVPGLFVADASLFPTSVGVPPQITIMTLATLIAQGMASSR